MYTQQQRERERARKREKERKREKKRERGREKRAWCNLPLTAMVAVTRIGKAISALDTDFSDRRTKVRTVKNRNTAMMPEKTGDSTHDATMPATPCDANKQSYIHAKPQDLCGGGNGRGMGRGQRDSKQQSVTMD